MARTTVRVQLELPKESMRRLRALKIRTEAASYAEVVRRALRLYEHLMIKGNAVEIKNMSGKTIEALVFL